MNKVKINYMGKEVEKEEVVPGIVKHGQAFLIRCSVSGNWTYANQERLARMEAKFGSTEKLGATYVGRVGKQQRKKTEEPS